MKRIMTIQDITCFGKCSVTIALPVISAIGVETAILPTALLSAHTLFPDNTKLDLGEEMPRIAGQWKRNGISFDAIYIGYLGTDREIETALRVIDQFADENTLVITDPVMGDHGRLYRGFDREYAGKCAELCGKSDLIVPNITEACLMTGMEYREKYDGSYLRDLCAGLCRICAGTVVITGASIEEGKTGFYGMRAETGESFFKSNSNRRDRRGLELRCGNAGFFALCVPGPILSRRSNPRASGAPILSISTIWSQSRGRRPESIDRNGNL